MNGLIISSIIIVLLIVCIYFVNNTPYGRYSPRYFRLYNHMRRLWADHVVYTRLYIIAVVDDGPQKEATQERLLQNQIDIGQIIVPYYGNDAADKLTKLLREHILIAADLVVEVKENSDNMPTSAFDRINADWHKNADEIAEFLSSANPHWSEDVLKVMLYDHLELTIQETSEYIQHINDVSTFDKVFTQAMHMADALTTGIASQFWVRFLA